MSTEHGLNSPRSRTRMLLAEGRESDRERAAMDNQRMKMGDRSGCLWQSCSSTQQHARVIACDRTAHTTPTSCAGPTWSNRFKAAPCRRTLPHPAAPCRTMHRRRHRRTMDQDGKGDQADRTFRSPSQPQRPRGRWLALGTGAGGHLATSGPEYAHLSGPSQIRTAILYILTYTGQYVKGKI